MAAGVFYPFIFYLALFRHKTFSRRLVGRVWQPRGWASRHRGLRWPHWPKRPLSSDICKCLSGLRKGVNPLRLRIDRLLTGATDSAPHLLIKCWSGTPNPPPPLPLPANKTSMLIPISKDDNLNIFFQCLFSFHINDFTTWCFLPTKRSYETNFAKNQISKIQQKKCITSLFDLLKKAPE